MWLSIYLKKSGEGIAYCESGKELTLKEGIEKSGGVIENGLAIWGPQNGIRIAFRLKDLGLEEMR